MKSYGAFVTIKYWCPNLFTEGDPEGVDKTPDELVRWLVKEESVLGLADTSGEIVSIDIREDSILSRRQHPSMFAIGFESGGMLDGPTPNLAEMLKAWGQENTFIFEYRTENEAKGPTAIKRYQWDNDLNTWQALLPFEPLKSPHVHTCTCGKLFECKGARRLNGDREIIDPCPLNRNTISGQFECPECLAKVYSGPKPRKSSH